jgi:hypothetical protein
MRLVTKVSLNWQRQLKKKKMLSIYIQAVAQDPDGECAKKDDRIKLCLPFLPPEMVSRIFTILNHLYWCNGYDDVDCSAAAVPAIR